MVELFGAMTHYEAFLTPTFYWIFTDYANCSQLIIKEKCNFLRFYLANRPSSVKTNGLSNHYYRDFHPSNRKYF